jgi:hypothetical protein
MRTTKAAESAAINQRAHVSDATATAAEVPGAAAALGTAAFARVAALAEVTGTETARAAAKLAVATERKIRMLELLIFSIALVVPGRTGQQRSDPMDQ